MSRTAALVTANQLPLVPAVTTPVVAAASGSTVPQDGTGENTPTLLYQTNYPMLVGADTLQQAGITGRGVTIAMLDSGLWQALSQNYGTRVLATIDVTNGGSRPVTGDPYGHGTHITSIAAGGARESLRQLPEHRAAGESRDRPRLQRRGGRQLRRRDQRPQLDRRQPREIQHPRGQPVVRRARPSLTTGTTRSIRR